MIYIPLLWRLKSSLDPIKLLPVKYRSATTARINDGITTHQGIAHYKLSQPHLVSISWEDRSSDDFG
jgi:hypothetical protein